jgi:hypothetical protein
LVNSGRGKFSNVREARQRKTDAFKADPVAFVDQLKLDIVKLKRKCEKLNKKPLIRLNGTSDVDWQRFKGSDGVSVYDAFPECQFIEYSKIPGRKAPSNVHITLSYSEANKKYAAKVARSDRNIAVVFRHGLPRTFLGRKVIDGDKHDARNLDPKGVVVGLLAKGSAKTDRTNFVIDQPESFKAKRKPNRMATQKTVKELGIEKINAGNLFLEEREVFDLSEELGMQEFAVFDSAFDDVGIDSAFDESETIRLLDDLEEESLKLAELV